MTFPILASLLVRLVVLLPFQLLRLSLATPSRWTPIAYPNFGRRVRNRRQLNSLQNTWPYGYSMPIAVRYTQDAFSRSGWLWPVDAKGEPLKATSYMAVGFYVAKYVNKKSDMDLAAKGLGAKEWNNSLKTKLSLL